MGRDMLGAPLVPGVNVDPVDVGAGLREALAIGYGDERGQMVALYVLQRWARGEEAGAERTWASEYPRDFTSFRRIIAAAVASPEARPCEACGAEPLEMCRFGCLGYALDNDPVGTEPCS